MSHSDTKSNYPPNNVDERQGKIASSKIALGDIRGAIRILSSENHVLPITEENYEALKLKHPTMPIDYSPPAEPSNADRDFSPLITRQELRKCINSFKRGSGSGHDGLTPDHLKDLINENLGICADDLLDSMCVLLNETVLPGKVPGAIRPIFYGAKLIALSKKRLALCLLPLG